MKSQQRYILKGNDRKNEILNVRMVDIFSTAKSYTQMPFEEIALLLNGKIYEVRMGAISIMDFQARDKKITVVHKKKLFDLYINNIKRINNWDLVDRGAPHIIGGYLFDKTARDAIQVSEKQKCICTTYSNIGYMVYIRKNQTDDTFKIAGILVHDKEEQVNMAVESWVRESGKRDPDQLIKFLDEYAATMPRITLRYAVEKLDSKLKKKSMDPARKSPARKTGKKL